MVTTVHGKILEWKKLVNCEVFTNISIISLEDTKLFQLLKYEALVFFYLAKMLHTVKWTLNTALSHSFTISLTWFFMMRFVIVLVTPIDKIDST